MNGIKEQRNNYIKWVHYKLFIDKRYKKIKKEVDFKTREIKRLNITSLQIDEEIDIIQHRKKELLGVIKHIKNKKDYSIYLLGDEHKYNWFKKIIDKILRADGFIFYVNKAKKFKLYRTKNMNDLWTKLSDQTYILNDFVGTFNNKPLLLIIYPYVMSLKPQQQHFVYDSEVLFKYIDQINLRNILQSAKQSLGQMMGGNFWKIILIGGAVLFYLTPQGREMINGVVGVTP